MSFKGSGIGVDGVAFAAVAELEDEGIRFDTRGRIDWADYAWEPTPDEVAAAVARDPFGPEVGAP